MRRQFDVYQAMSSPSKLEGAGGSVFFSTKGLIFSTFAHLHTPPVSPLLPCPRGGAACGGGEGGLEGELIHSALPIFNNTIET